MADLCDDHDPNTVVTVLPQPTESGVHEQSHFIEAAVGIDQLTINGSLDE
ncbi:MAG: hypothetical protein ACI9O0_000246 [Paracoccaceae bacterium]|jgi:hypothetical protein